MCVRACSSVAHKTASICFLQTSILGIILFCITKVLLTKRASLANDQRMQVNIFVNIILIVFSPFLAPNQLCQIAPGIIGTPLQLLLLTESLSCKMQEKEKERERERERDRDRDRDTHTHTHMHNFSTC